VPARLRKIASTKTGGFWLWVITWSPGAPLLDGSGGVGGRRPNRFELPPERLQRRVDTACVPSSVTSGGSGTWNSFLRRPATP
jgi:hypothetical protein